MASVHAHSAAPPRQPRRPLEGAGRASPSAPAAEDGVDHPHHDAADQQRRPHDYEALEILPDHLAQQKAPGWPSSTNAMSVSDSGCVSTVRSPRSPRGNVLMNFENALAEVDRQAEDRPELNHDRSTSSSSCRYRSHVEQERLGDPQVGGGADRQKLGQTLRRSPESTTKDKHSQCTPVIGESAGDVAMLPSTQASGDSVRSPRVRLHGPP